MSLEWHETDALILNDPLGILWNATKGRNRLIASSQASTLVNDNGLRQKIEGVIQKFIRTFKMTEDEWVDIRARYPLSAVNTLDGIEQVGLAALKELSRVMLMNEFSGAGISTADEILEPIFDAIAKTNIPKDVFRLTEEGLALLELVIGEDESAANEDIQSKEEELEFENIDAIAF
jgi:hypothetical protein